MAVDTLQHEADRKLQLLRREMDQAIARGLQKSRLPPHLQNILKDRRTATQLFRLGKTDPVMALFEQVRWAVARCAAASPRDVSMTLGW